MQLRLKTKITLTTAALVLAVVGVNSTLYVMNLSRQVIRQAQDRAQLVSRQVFFQAQVALADAAKAGEAPATDSPEDLRAYVQKAFDESAPLASSIDAQMGYSPADLRNLYFGPQWFRAGLQRQVLARKTDSGSRRHRSTGFRQFHEPAEGALSPAVRPALARLRSDLSVPAGPARPPDPFRCRSRRGADRPAAREYHSGVAFGGDFWRWPRWEFPFCSPRLSAAFLSRRSNGSPRNWTASPKANSTRSRSSADDEFGQVSTKISQIGMQLRGVREIFSNLRENIDQVLGGLDDGLLLFSVDGRAVMVSPAVERFLSTPSDQLLGRRAEDIFPPDHDVREVVMLHNGELMPVDSAEVVMSGIDGPARRVGVSVEIIGEGKTRMGTLVKFKDLESRERIGTQLQVSERLANLGRITAGVAHEVKNPLNSMRIWLENLKASLPPDVDGLPLQAVRVLDSEIDRLDSVVKRFLDFTRPPEMHQEESSLKEILEEVIAVERPEFDKANIKIDAQPAADVPTVLVDKPLLKQALLNLLVNAV